MTHKDTFADGFLRSATATLALRKSSAPLLRSMEGLRPDYYVRGTRAPAIEFGRSSAVWGYFRDTINAESMVRSADFYDVVILESHLRAYKGLAHVSLFIPDDKPDLLRTLYTSSNKTAEFRQSPEAPGAVVMVLSKIDSREFAKNLK